MQKKNTRNCYERPNSKSDWNWPERKEIPRESIFRNRVQLYLFGHEHIVQHLKPEEGVHFLDAPAGGQGVRTEKSGPMTLFTDSFWGFAALEFDSERIRVEMVDTEGQVRYRTEIR